MPMFLVAWQSWHNFPTNRCISNYNLQNVDMEKNKGKDIDTTKTYYEIKTLFVVIVLIFLQLYLFKF